MDSRFYTTYEVARMCQVTPGSVSRWIREGKLKTAVTPGGHHRVRANVVFDFLKGMRMPIPSELLSEHTFRIVLVDDDTALRNMLREVLQKKFPKSNIEIREAEDGFSAGTLISEFSPDLVILDVNLPGVDGLRVCRSIKEKSALQHTKVIIITGALNADAKKLLLQEGADDCLFKPFSITDFVGKVEEFLEKAKEL